MLMRDIIMAAATQTGGAAAAAYGPELVSNGTFANSTGWTLSNLDIGSNPTISGGKLNFTDQAGDGKQLASTTAADTIGASQTFLITGDASNNSGVGVDIRVGNSSIPLNVAANGAFSGTVQSGLAPTQSITLLQTDDSATISIDNLSVKRVL